MKRWLLLPPLFALGLVLAMHATAGTKGTNDVNATANLLIVNGNYELAVANTGDMDITSFTFVPGPTLKVARIVSTTKGTCQLSGAGFTCTVTLAPPPCPCNGGEDVKVDFAGSGESASSKVQIGALSVTATGGGGLTTTAATTTTQTTTTTPTPTTPTAPKAQKLAGKVGPGARITLSRAAKAGKTTVAVADLSANDNFHLSGPGVNKKTGVAFMGKVTWSLSLKKGSYTYRSDAHSGLRGTLKVS
jgi:hypothetical protein